MLDSLVVIQHVFNTFFRMSCADCIFRAALQILEECSLRMRCCPFESWCAHLDFVHYDLRTTYANLSKTCVWNGKSIDVWAARLPTPGAPEFIVEVPAESIRFR